MTQNIYEIFQEVFPELKQQDLPDDLTEFTTFRDWLNQDHSFIQYVEIKEYEDNGINESTVFQQKQVNAEALNQAIENEIDIFFESFEYEDEDEDAGDIEVQQQKVEAILFDQIKLFAEQKQLSLLVIFRENPHWLVVPTQDELQLQRIVDVFNQSFKRDDLTMGMY